MTSASDADPVGSSARARFVVESGWFDATWYAEQAGSPAAADPLKHWLTLGAATGRAPSPWLASVQDQQGRHAAVTDTELDEPDEDDPQLLREIALVAASGLFDERFYRSQVDDLGEEAPLAHFCRVGWRLLHRPARDFDVWWYWSTHLDPSSEALNPFVHYLILGRLAGWTGRPASLATSGGWLPPADRPVRRICLFAGFDAHGVVDDTVVAYVRELSRFADVYYLSDSYLASSELAKLEGITRGAWSVRHGCYDFGSYSMLAHDLVGWETIRSYDELLLVNDSCYLLKPLDDVFAAMDRRACDWWGLQATKGLAATADAPANRFPEPIPLDEVRDGLLGRWEDDDVYDFHVGSYFLAYRRPVLDDSHFRRLLDSVHQQRTKSAIIHKYEIGLTHTLLGSGHAFDTYVEAVYPFHPLFTAWYFELLARGFPLLKRYLIYQNHYDVPDLREWRDRVAAHAPAADLDAIEAHLHRVAPEDRLARSLAITAERPAPVLLEKGEVRRLDRRTPTFDHWWAFPVDPDTDDLPDSSRAVFEEVRDDPSIHKVVLTRARFLHLTGERVTELPLRSAEGQEHLVRCGQVFVGQQPRRTIGGPLTTDHDFHVLGEHPQLIAWGALRPGVDETRSKAPASLLAVSDVDHLTVVAAHRPVLYRDVWRLGSPARDLLVRPAERLPADLRDAERRLRDSLEGRRLLLVAPAWRRTAIPAPPVADEVAEALRAWAGRHDVVVGVREPHRDLDRRWSRALDTWARDLSTHREPASAAVLRVADAVLTDYHGVATTLAALGRPVLGYVPDLDESDDVVHDLDLLFPGPVCRTVAELERGLESLLVDDAELDERTRARLLRTRRAWTDEHGHDPTDDRSAARLVRRVRRAYAGAEEVS